MNTVCMLQNTRAQDNTETVQYAAQQKLWDYVTRYLVPPLSPSLSPPLPPLHPSLLPTPPPLPHPPTPSQLVGQVYLSSIIWQTLVSWLDWSVGSHLHDKVFATWKLNKVFKALFESRSMNQGNLWTATINGSRMQGFGSIVYTFIFRLDTLNVSTLTFEPLKVNYQKLQKGAIKQIVE